MPSSGKGAGTFRPFITLFGKLVANKRSSLMYQDIFPEEVSQWKEKGAQIIDVREPGEYTRGHLPGAVNIPLGQLPKRTDEVEEPVMLVCASGNRSGQAAQYLAEQGYEEVANLMGGTAGWRQRGLPTE
jgi:rhodanese-related sulfurtransferase